MTTPIVRPTNLKLPFAVEGAKNTIPYTATGSNLASFPEGFPPVCSLPLTSGGIPPEGDDFNGVLFDITAHTLWVNAGGQYQFDAALSTYIGGYSKGMVLQNNAGTASYISLIDNNTTDFNSTPSSIGTMWGTFAGAAFSGASVATTGGSTTLTTAQLSASVIVVSGALASNVTLIFPAALAKYFVVNNTTGPYLVNCIASASAVPIKQAAADLIYCDGSNMRYQQASGVTQTPHDVSKSLATTYYADRVASRAGGEVLTDSGSANAYVVATIPVSTSYVNGQTLRFTPSATNTIAACTCDAGAGAKTIVRGDGSAPRPGDIIGVVTLSYSATLDKWVMNGLIVPDIAITRMTYVNATRTLPSGDYLIDTTGGPFACNLPTSPSLGDSVMVRDAIGSWVVSPFTLIATGGYQIQCVTANGTVWVDTTVVDNIRGHQFLVWFNGTAWELY